MDLPTARRIGAIVAMKKRARPEAPKAPRRDAPAGRRQKPRQGRPRPQGTKTAYYACVSFARRRKRG